MAEVKNSFLQSKMNKDLDDRLIPNGQYRDALNISIGKAEDKDVGALEGALGNTFMVDTGNSNLVCIGQVSDNQNNRVFQFWTDYTAPRDPDDKYYAVPDQDVSVDMKITMYTPDDSLGTLQTLVSGRFLNFATNAPFRIVGANVLENLLFWTDNRNQPRKINITKAANDSGYYTDEVQISVAKYAPVVPMSVYSEATVTTTSAGTIPTENPQSIYFTVSTADALKLNVGMQLLNPVVGSNNLDLQDYAVITKISGTIITVSIPKRSPTPISISSGESLSFYGSTMTNQADTPGWSGDPSFLKEKFVRFSYRYKFDDGEYSLMAPFTQIMFIPNQNGYFLNGNEQDAYRSTVVTWFENYINNIILHVQLPDTGNKIANTYKIQSIDILYKESDSNSTQVIETVALNQIVLLAGDTSDYYYTYKSQKPYKTLPDAQTVRVYDKVPIRARAQDVAGNRVIYGNFINKSTPPASLDYNLAVIKKRQPFDSWAQYPNHTLKQNRNYQAGFILADKFGRQSSVILSSNDLSVDSNGSTFVGSTIYSPYFTADDGEIVKDWRGNTLALILNSPIASSINEGAGTPGLYAIVSGTNGQTNQGFQITNATIIPGSNGTIYTYDLAGGSAQSNFPVAGNYLRGKYTDYVKVLDGAMDGYLETDGEISDDYLYTGTDPDIKYAYDINQLGWYSYKIVVRQQQQEYYNVYLPGFLNGYPMYQSTTAPGIDSPASNPTKFPTGETNKTAHTVLLNDNINKIPRDLSEIGPDQKQYRSSVQLFGRVENVLDSVAPYYANNKQYFPARKPDVASTIATSADLNFLPLSDATNKYGTASNNIYQLNTTPSIARISTVNRIGVIATTSGSAIAPVLADTMNPFLSIYETAPVVSLLELFWETSTSGIISDINADVLKTYSPAVDFDSFIYVHKEFQNPNGTDPDPTHYGSQNSRYITNSFQCIDNSGNPMTTIDNIILTVKDHTGADRTSDFNIHSTATNKYAIRINSPFVFLTTAAAKETYDFTFNIFSAADGNSVITKTGYSLSNSAPVLTNPSEPPPAPPLYTVFLANPPIAGSIYTCTGTNGAPATSDPNFNKQQLQWTLLNTSTPSDYATYFSINQSNGVISLLDVSILPNVPYTLDIRLTDTYNYGINAPGSGSLHTDGQISVIRSIGDVHCEVWQSQVTTHPGVFRNTTQGYFNFWKEFFPGETINASNSVVQIVSYTDIDGNDYFAPYDFSSYNTGYITWEDSNIFQGNFTIINNQGLEGVSPTSYMHVVGTISVQPSNRIINVDFYSASTIVEENISSTDTCTTGIPPYTSDTKIAWKLKNEGITPITWNALTTSGPNDSVIGGVLNPGVTISSANSYGGTYPCIFDGSLTFGSGGHLISSTECLE